MLASTIVAKQNTTFDLIRRQGHTYDETGYATAPQDVHTQGHAGIVQPAGGKDMQLLPTGTRVTQTRTLYTDVPLRTVDSGTHADIVVIGGIHYEVKELIDRMLDGGYVKALIVRMTRQPHGQDP